MRIEEKILDVGCGSTKVNDATGIDVIDLPGVDIVHDLNSFPWPISNESYDRIIFSHSISHLDNVAAVLIECHRILKINGCIEIVAPHYSSDNFNTDPTHRFSLGYRSMNYFCENIDFRYKYIDVKKHGFHLLETSLSFRENATSWRANTKFNPFSIVGIEALVNYVPRLYERFATWVLPLSEVRFLLRKSH